MSIFQVFVDEGEAAMFECRVEPKHDLNLSGGFIFNSCVFKFISINLSILRLYYKLLDYCINDFVLTYFS